VVQIPFSKVFKNGATTSGGGVKKCKLFTNNTSLDKPEVNAQQDKNTSSLSHGLHKRHGADV